MDKDNDEYGQLAERQTKALVESMKQTLEDALRLRGEPARDDEHFAFAFVRHLFLSQMQRAEKAEAALAEAVALRDKAMGEAAAMEEFLSAASRHEKEASAIINSLTADISITVPLRDYSEMSPKDCYELGMMDSVAALKAQINTAVDAAFAAGKKDE